MNYISEVRDDLTDFIEEESARDPEFRSALADAQARSAIVEDLRRHREELGMTQRDVAEAMDVSQPAVSEFENRTDDFYLSTLQRYARSLGLVLRMECQHAEPVGESRVSRESSTYRATPLVMSASWGRNSTSAGATEFVSGSRSVRPEVHQDMFAIAG